VRSFRKIINGHASIIYEEEYEGSAYYQNFSFDEWLVKGVGPDKPFTSTRHLDIELPEIIQKPYSKFHVQKLPLRAKNIFARDGWKCWYCGERGNLTMDHIYPKSKGGKGGWKNLIAACKPCNNKKGDIFAEEFCKSIDCPVPTPINASSYPWLKDLGKSYPKSWDKWLTDHGIGLNTHSGDKK